MCHRTISNINNFLLKLRVILQIACCILRSIDFKKSKVKYSLEMEHEKKSQLHNMLKYKFIQ